MVKQFKEKFLNLKIKEKFLGSYIIIIFLTFTMISISSYIISKNSITEKSIQSSKYLMEQLSANFENHINSMTDSIFVQIYNSKLDKTIKIDDDENFGTKYNKKREIDKFSFSLLNYNSYIKAVIIADLQGNKYYNSYNTPQMSSNQMDDILKKDKTESLWGKPLWQPYNDELIFVNRLIYDSDKLNKVGIISIGIDIDYFVNLYKNISADKGSEIIVFDGEGNVLIKSDKMSDEMVEFFISNYDINKKTINIWYDNKEYMYTSWDLNDGSMKLVKIVDMGVLLKDSSLVLKWILYIGVISIIVALIIANFIANNISNNVKLLLKNIKVMSEGNFRTRILPVSYDEIGMLAVEFNEMAKKIEELLETIYDEKVKKKNAQIKALQFEYDALQAKINPHFLYNTLETMNSIAKIHGDYETSRMAYLLGNLLRETISNKNNVIILEEEMEYIKSYLEIQQISYRDKIEVRFDFDEALMDAVVPKFILQPIVENAIVHGLEKKIGKGIIIVSSKCDAYDMILEVYDDGVGIDKCKIKNILRNEDFDIDSDKKHTKVGINSVNKRIKILYGDEYGVQIQSDTNRGTKISVRLPLNFETEVKLNEL
ncbi:two-component system sensor histidine kinase YesM [Vallitalea sediminicola]